MFIAKSIFPPAKLRQERHEKAARSHAAPTELGLIYCPKSTNRSRLTALSLRCRGQLFNRLDHVLDTSNDFRAGDRMHAAEIERAFT